MNSSRLRIDWTTYRAAKFACENWHYSKCIPKGKQVFLGVWENGEFVGVVMIGRPAFPSIVKPFGLKQTEVVELTRIALRKHLTPVSRIVAISIRMLKKQSPGLRVIVSMADPERDHHGGIYQASNWIYVGQGQSSKSFKLTNGRIVHERTAIHMFGDLRRTRNNGSEMITHQGKHKYVMPLDHEIRERIEPLRRPYPKRIANAA